MTASSRRRGGQTWPALLLLVLFAGPAARADEPAVTTLADYEDDSVAAHITDVQNVLASDCAVRTAAIPAHGQRSLVVEIGATERGASVACDLRFRLATRFEQATHVATYAWINQGSVEIGFRVRDAAGRLFETPAVGLRAPNRWVRIVADLTPNQLEVVGPGRTAALQNAKPAWPIQIAGYRIRVQGVGRQTVYLDDLEVEHPVSGAALLRGEFVLDKPTHIYEPGAFVRAAVVLENTSRQHALPLSVETLWLRSDGSKLATARQSLNLPASGSDFRSRQTVDFSQRIAEPGLYRFVTRAYALGWPAPAVFEASIAVTPTNRNLPRGRATFFGVKTNLLREPLADQLLEIDVAREIGVQLLALDTPWRMIEPRKGTYDLADLDKVVKLISERDIAILIVLSEPPDWQPEGAADWWERQAALFETLVRRYGTRISAFQALGAPGRGGQLRAADLAALQQIHERVAQVRSEIEVVTPPIAVPSDGEQESPPPAGPGLQIACETAGDPGTAILALRSFAAQHGLHWSSRYRWFHRAEPLSGTGTLYDAVAVLRYYVEAAASGVAGAVWFDLRDVSNDPRHPEQMIGLTQRDFSPRSPLLGLANTIGQLTGLVHVGKLAGTPAEFESALFIGGQRQVAVVFPRPNRVLPAVLAPYQIVPGELSVSDFDRRGRPLLTSVGTPLLLTLQAPFFIALDAQRAQADPQLGLARPWLRVPGTVYCGEEATFRIELDAPTELRRSYIALTLPPDLPLKSSLSSRTLRADTGDTLAFDVTLTRTGEQPIEPAELTLRLRLESSSLEIPLALRPLFDVRPIASPAKITDADFTVARLTPADSKEQVQPDVVLSAAYDRRVLHVALRLPAEASPDAVVRFGVAAEGSDTHTEALLDSLRTVPRLSPAKGTTGEQIRRWQYHMVEQQAGAARSCQITIPAESIGLRAFEPGTRLLVSARYLDPSSGDGKTPIDVRWGAGLDGTRSTVGFQWIRLTEHP